jgi:antitoxin ParD1/3/4
MKITLTPEIEQLIQEKVNSGKYSSVSEIIGEGMRLLEARDRDKETQLVVLKEKIKQGIDAANRGELIDADEVFAELENDICQAENKIKLVEEVES